MINHFENFTASKSLFHDFLRFNNLLNEREIQIQELSKRLGESFSNFDSLIKYFEIFADIQTNMNDINKKLYFYFKNKNLFD
jgi:hypothetical protein